MKNSKHEMIQSILLILKMDAENLFDRIRIRKREYLKEFSMKRSREHFADIFRNKYKEAQLADLKYCGPEVVVALDQFYTKVFELEWYLNHTEDMLGAVEDKTDALIKSMQKSFDILTVYMEAALEVHAQSQSQSQFQSESDENHHHEDVKNDTQGMGEKNIFQEGDHFENE